MAAVTFTWQATPFLAGSDIASGGHDNTFGGGAGSIDAFLVKFNANGVRQWATFYGGVGNERGYSTATDGTGNVYLTGYTVSTTDIATPGSHDTSFGGMVDAFLVKFNASGVRQWGTYYGGTGDETGYCAVVDCSGNVYLAGETTSTTNIATTGSHDNSFGGGTYDAFLVKFNINGVRQWATYYGGLVMIGPTQPQWTAMAMYTWPDGPNLQLPSPQVGTTPPLGEQAMPSW